MADDWNQSIITEFRANEGRVGGPFEGAPMVVLTTKGAKTGQSRTTPLVYLPDGDRLVIFASKAGAPTHPSWYHNLIANPQVSIEVGADTYLALAVPVEGEERDQLFARQVKVMPGFGEYQAKTSRVIPVIALYRQAS